MKEGAAGFKQATHVTIATTPDTVRITKLQPQHDTGDKDDGQVVAPALFVPGRYSSKIFKTIDKAFYRISAFVRFGVKLRGPSTHGASLQTALLGVFALGADTARSTLSQHPAVLRCAVRSVHSQRRYMFSRTTQPDTGNANRVENDKKVRSVGSLPFTNND